MITGEHNKLAEIAKYNVCTQHKTALEIAWHDKQWVLRCGGNGGHYPDTVTRQLSLTEAHKAGEPLPSFIEDNIKKRQRRKAMTQGKAKQFEEYGLMPIQDLGSGVLLLPEQIQLLLLYAKKGGLDPWLGHVVLMYSKPYITIDGYLYHARQTGKEYSLESRPMTTQEKENYMLGATDHGWISLVKFPKTGETFTGIGVVTYSEMTEESKRHPGQLASPVVASHPWLLGQKRADWQALRRAFPIGGEG